MITITFCCNQHFWQVFSFRYSGFLIKENQGPASRQHEEEEEQANRSVLDKKMLANRKAEKEKSYS